MANSTSESTDVGGSLQVDNDDSTEQMSITQLTVLVDMGAHNKTPTHIFEYEKPVLEEIHGITNVIVQDSEEVDVDYFNAAEAYAALLRKYKQHEADIKAVYRNVKELAKESGLDYEEGDDTRQQFNGAVQYKNGKKVGAKSSSAKKTAAKKAAK